MFDPSKAARRDGRDWRQGRNSWGVNRGLLLNTGSLLAIAGPHPGGINKRPFMDAVVGFMIDGCAVLNTDLIGAESENNSAIKKAAKAFTKNANTALKISDQRRSCNIWLTSLNHRIPLIRKTAH